MAEMMVEGPPAAAPPPPLRIPLPSAPFPLLPRGRYNVAQMLKELACASQTAARPPLPRGHGGAGACGALGYSQEAEDKQVPEHCGHQSASATPPSRTRPRSKQTRINPFEALMQEPEETQVEGRWRLGEATSGVVRDLCCLYPVAGGRKQTAMMQIFGGPWLLEHTRLQSNGGAILRLCSLAHARCSRSVLEGAALPVLPLSAPLSHAGMWTARDTAAGRFCTSRVLCRRRALRRQAWIQETSGRPRACRWSSGRRLSATEACCKTPLASCTSKTRPALLAPTPPSSTPIPVSASCTTPGPPTLRARHKCRVEVLRVLLSEALLLPHESPSQALVLPHRVASRVQAPRIEEHAPRPLARTSHLTACTSVSRVDV